MECETEGSYKAWNIIISTFWTTLDCKVHDRNIWLVVLQYLFLLLSLLKQKNKAELKNFGTT